MKPIRYYFPAAKSNKEAISPAGSYNSAGIIPFTVNTPPFQYASPAPIANKYTFIGQYRTINIYLEGTPLSSPVNVTVSGKSFLTDPISPTAPVIFYPPTLSAVEVAVQAIQTYKLDNFWQEITSIEIDGAIPTGTTISVGFGIESIIGLINPDYNSGSPMHYSLQTAMFHVDPDIINTTFTSQFFGTLDIPSEVTPDTPDLTVFDELNFVPISAPFTGNTVGIISSSVPLVGTTPVPVLAPLSRIMAYINDANVDPDFEGTSDAIITFVQQGIGR